MILTFLSMIDIVAGSLILLGVRMNLLVAFFATFIMSKALFSLVSSISHNSYLDWMGAIDFFASLGMFLYILVGPNSFTHTTAMLLLGKGIYSLILSRGS